ncbi:MAG: DNA repair protein RadC [Deltaproteobacteria bacterium]|nr:DNA repair protein RadC [Deltaproteobacteria bacterium]
MTPTASSPGHRKRLKTRFDKTALEGFHDYEVVELLLTFAIPRRDVKPLAKDLVKRFGGLKGVFEAGLDELSSVGGIGENTAVLLMLLKEAAGAYLLERMMSKYPPIRSPRDVIEFLDATLTGEKAERFLAIYLNSKNEILGVEPLHEGAISGMAVAPKKVIEKAFKHNARSIIFVHNHPEGKACPAREERALAEELEAAAGAIDILIHDYLITGGAKHFSAREAGWLGRVK